MRASKLQSNDLPDFNSARLAGMAALVSLFSFFYFFRHNDILLYGDAVAHINIARRVFDSQTPGLLQLGTVWLPLPHLLMMPFVFFNSLWQNGAGGSVPSMMAYVFGVMGIFRFVRGVLESNARTKSAAGVGSWVAAVAYAANPNLIYIQSTAMSESIYLAFFVWTTAFLAEFVRSSKSGRSAATPDSRGAYRSLLHSGWCLMGAELTRYDGWFLGGIVGVAVIVLALRRWQDLSLRRHAAKFLLVISAAPCLWLAYNGIVYGNALEFANGAYSAKAIEQRVGAPNPAQNNVLVAGVYFLKSAQLNLAEGNWGRFWLAAAFSALVLVAWRLQSQLWLVLLFCVALIFYALSIAYGSVPIHVSIWWPFAVFNQRYGLQLLPLFAISGGVLAAFAYGFAPVRHRAKFVALILALGAASYGSVWKVEPQCLTEARRNWQSRHSLDAAVQRIVSRLPPHSRFLMDVSDHVEIMEQAGIPLRQVINNENHRPWKRPADPEGIWERALRDPSHYVNFAIAFDGDLVDRNLEKAGLTTLAEIHVSGQPYARIYAAGGGR